MILQIVDERISSGKLTDEEIAARLETAELRSRGRSAEESPPNIGGIGLIPVYGPIFGKANMMTELSGATSMDTFKNDLNEMLNNDMIRSILLEFDSPGGTKDLVPETAELIRAAREVKPIYAIANMMAGSAAYWLMSQATAGYMTPSGSVGSVGAYTVHTDQSVKDQQQGLRFTYISAGPHKTEGNPHEPLSQETKDYVQKRIDQTYDEFVEAVASGRGLTTDHIEENFGGGRLVTAKNALENKMVDGIMTYDALVNTLVNQPKQQRVAIVAGDRTMATAVFDHATSKLKLMTVADKDSEFLGELDGALLESKEWEHSEPGTGSPPKPRTDEDGSDDPAIKGGWRRDPLPVPLEDPAAPKTSPGKGNSNLNGNKEGEEMAEGTATGLDALLKLFGVDTEEKLIEAITAEHTELSSLRDAVNTKSEEERMKSQFPSMWKEHVELLEANRKGKALSFVESIGKIMQPATGGGEGDEALKPTTMGLSALARDTIEANHLKFSQGQGTLEDFEAAVKAVTQGGVVDYGETGSARTSAEPEVDASTQSGLKSAREQFAAKVAEIQESDKLEFDAALAEAAKRYPTLANAYRQASPVGN